VPLATFEPETMLLGGAVDPFPRRRKDDLPYSGEGGGRSGDR
jgi:hypothetical protein